MQEQYIIGIKKEKNEENKYPYNIAAIKHLTYLKMHPKVTFLCGENGSGKSTLLEAIAVKYGLNPEGGSANFNFVTSQTHSDLYESISIHKGIKRPIDSYFLRAETFYNVATQIEKMDVNEPGDWISPPVKLAYGGKSLHQYSHGESFETLIYERFMGEGIYLLDEPEAALSPTRQIEMLTRIHDLVKQDSQFIIATHSPILLAYPNSIIYQVTEEGFQEISYEETMHYQTMKLFLNHYQTMVEELLKDE